MRIGSPPDAAHAAGSISAKSLVVGSCQDQRRLSMRSCRGASGSGSVTRTVNRRMALTGGLYWAGAPDAGSTRQQLLVSAPSAPNIRFTTCRFRGNYLLDGKKPVGERPLILRQAGMFRLN